MAQNRKKNKKTPKKKARGRPPIRKMPELIDASPDEIAKVVLQSPPKKEWRYLKK